MPSEFMIKSDTANNNGTMLRASETKVAGSVAGIIRARILEGSYSPGQRLIEAELIDELAVSRTTVREAILKLDGEGFIEMRHQRGAIVTRLTKETMTDMFAIRERLEGLAAGLAAGRIDQGDNRQRMSAERLSWLPGERADDSIEHMERNAVFHETIVALSGNERLAKMLKPLQVPGYRMQYLRLLGPERRNIASDEHVAIADAILCGDASAAEALMHSHVRNAGALALQLPGLG